MSVCSCLYLCARARVNNCLRIFYGVDASPLVYVFSYTKCFAVNGE